jgi:hypothetical protein
MSAREEALADHIKACDAQKIKSAWASTEPHYFRWTAHGMDCMIIRSQHLLHLCGYVGVNKEHPLYGAHYDRKDTEHLTAHGGLTFSDHHAPKFDGDGLWWFGFDCAHHLDWAPAMKKHDGPFGRDVYRDFDYVKQETEDLAKQLAVKNEESI